MARQNVSVDKNSREYHEQQIAGARSTLLFVLVLTLVNVGMILANSSMFFLFSVFVPYIVVMFGRNMDAGMFGSYTTAALVIAVVIIVIFALCWLLSKKKHGLLTLAAVLFGLDTVALLFFTFVLAADPAGQIVDILLHIYVLVYLIRGSVHAGKLKKQTEETLEDPASTGVEF